jgi:host factor-I protein
MANESKKQEQSLQDRKLLEWKYLNKQVTIFLMNGVPVKGQIVEYDYYTVLIADKGKESLIYKHAISTIV